MFYEFTTAPPLRLQNYIVIVLKIGQDLPSLDLKLTFFSSFYFGPVHVHLFKFLISKLILIIHNFYPGKISRKSWDQILTILCKIFSLLIVASWILSCSTDLPTISKTMNSSFHVIFDRDWPTKISFKILFCLLFCFFIINNLIG